MSRFGGLAGSTPGTARPATRPDQREREMMHKPTGVMCAACNLAGITREIVGYVNDTVPYATVRWDVMGDPRKRVPVCQTCADWRETVDHDDQTFDNLHRCTDCGVTGGGVQNGLCQDCAAVPA